MEYVGLAGSILFALCGVPAAYSAIKDRTCQYSWPFLWMWFLGEVLTSIYVIYLEEWILLLNYGANFICLIILMYYNKRK